MMVKDGIVQTWPVPKKGETFREICGDQAYNLKVLITEQELRRDILMMTNKLCDNFHKQGRRKPVFVGILKGAFYFLPLLTRDVYDWGRGKPPIGRIAPEFDFIPVSSYQDKTDGVGMESSGLVDIRFDERTKLTDRDVVIVEDIGDTLRTLRDTVRRVWLTRPRSVTVVCMVQKFDVPNAVDFKVDYAAVLLPNRFLVGCGLDYKQHLRYLPFIAELIGMESLDEHRQ